MVVRGGHVVRLGRGGLRSVLGLAFFACFDSVPACAFGLVEAYVGGGEELVEVVVAC